MKLEEERSRIKKSHIREIGAVSYELGELRAIRPLDQERRLSLLLKGFVCGAHQIRREWFEGGG